MTELKKIATEPKVLTFGCRLNTYESEVMKNHAIKQGLENTIIVNTCAVTNEAERQSRQAIRRARRENPDAHIIVTGCSVQIKPEVYAGMPEVDRVLGNHEKMLEASFAPQLPSKVLVQDIMDIEETAHHLISGFENQVRAFIQIQNGCNHRCTFCTIPFGRGNNRSVPMGEITNQVRLLVEKGCKEIVFTGVDITDYGKDLPGAPTLGQMIKRVLAQVPLLQRLRLSSLDPAELDEDVFTLIENEPRLMPHFHISLQAGDDLILKRMKRRHLRHHVIDFCNRVRRLRPDAVFGADIIVGFPTETEEQFQNTLRIVEECGLTYLHVFPYSARQGTPAARMPQVQGTLIKERATRLRELGKKVLWKFLQEQVGKTFSIIVEQGNKGHTEHYAPIAIESDKKLVLGSLIQVHITHMTTQNDLLGRVV